MITKIGHVFAVLGVVTVVYDVALLSQSLAMVGIAIVLYVIEASNRGRAT